MKGDGTSDEFFDPTASGTGPPHSTRPSVQADSRLIASKNRSQGHPARLRQEWTTHRLFYSFNFGVEWVSYQT